MQAKGTTYAQLYWRPRNRSSGHPIEAIELLAVTAAVWFLSMERPGARAEWDWNALGSPNPRDLLPTRRPTSADFSRHIPRRAYSVTTAAPMELESGLEHDLLKWLDLRLDVTWLVSQPVVLHFPVPERRRAVLHTPDLLSQHMDGSVTLWDARPDERVDELFRVKAAMTDEACRRVGWSYEIFTGLPTSTRMNLLWLNGYRHPKPWHPRYGAKLRALLDGRTLPVRDLRLEDDGTGELIATMWHLIASGVITCDLSRPIRDETNLAWSEPLTDDEKRHRPGFSADGAAHDATGAVALPLTRLRTAGMSGAAS